MKLGFPYKLNDFTKNQTEYLELEIQTLATEFNQFSKYLDVYVFTGKGL